MVLGDDYGGITGDPDTSLAEYGGLLGYALADTSEGSDPYFNNSDDQTEGGAPVVDGGWNQDSDSDVVPDFPFTPEGAGNVPWGILIPLAVVSIAAYAIGQLFTFEVGS